VTADGTRRDIVDFGIGMPERWYPMPLAAGSDPEWATALAASVVADQGMRAKLADELAFARSRFRELRNPALTAAVWIPYPEIGRAGAALVFSLAPLDVVGTPDQYQDALASPIVEPDSGQSYFAVQTWRSAVDAGELVGSHNLIAHALPDGSAELEERVVAVVYPPEAAQVVQFVASAENLGVFTDMASDVQALVATLNVTLADAAVPERSA
jgi:hypothetical protein